MPTPGNVPSEEDMYDTMAYRMAFMRYVCSNGAKELPGEYRSNENTTTTDVGAVIPTTIMNRIVEKMQAVGMILPLVTQTNLRGGVTYPTSTVKPVATWVAEGATSDKQKKSITGITFAYHKLRCAVSITLETEQITLSAFEMSLVNGIAEAMVKALEEAIINGSERQQYLQQYLRQGLADSRSRLLCVLKCSAPEHCLHHNLLWQQAGRWYLPGLQNS